MKKNHDKNLALQHLWHHRFKLGSLKTHLTMLEKKRIYLQLWRYLYQNLGYEETLHKTHEKCNDCEYSLIAFWCMSCVESCARVSNFKTHMLTHSRKAVQLHTVQLLLQTGWKPQNAHTDTCTRKQIFHFHSVWKLLHKR